MHKIHGVLQLVVSGFGLMKYGSILIAAIILGSNYDYPHFTGKKPRLREARLAQSHSTSHARPGLKPSLVLPGP